MKLLNNFLLLTVAAQNIADIYGAQSFDQLTDQLIDGDYDLFDLERGKKKKAKQEAEAAEAAKYGAGGNPYAPSKKPIKKPTKIFI